MGRMKCLDAFYIEHDSIQQLIDTTIEPQSREKLAFQSEQLKISNAN